ncbi:type II toxin-antitoxin system VapC family toxin [Geminocystis sp. GBBB08]|uniref:type II toxin-antitoxin system VapC family toxin n=1 Tax=Geminocystis sp. GBBB08 TaxID=2604140 RepID=UPI0027E391CA|nr:type II toxin-antitoxin system VapC family toxin [Geminocystis sp. GBBB08]MBL1209017.1 type II toxin-antitoxin system VapC family toxin [Geminocystis sp. GBBB08]
MNLLIDTHIFLWFVNDNSQLSDHLKDLIEDKNNQIYLSLASLWEMSIKYNLGKLKFDTSYEEFIDVEISQSCLNLLNIEVKHFNINATLPLYHRDPFDRLIIAQSISENMPIISMDYFFSPYPITLIN